MNPCWKCGEYSDENEVRVGLSCSSCFAKDTAEIRAALDEVNRCTFPSQDGFVSVSQ